jgi:branched-chain amino acid aminotransferase
MGEWAFYNDDFVLESNCAVPASDLAVQRGYGVFDFFKTVLNKPLFFDAHLLRFRRSAEAMRLPVNKTREELKAIIHQLIYKNELPDSGIRLTLTGGVSPDGFTLGKPNLIITQQPLAPASPALESGIRLITYEHQRQLPQVKTIDYLMAIWLQPRLATACADDILFYTSNHGITECPRANFFLVAADGTLVTPGEHILEGITRSRILRLTGENVVEGSIALSELKTAREAFITSTTKQVLPVIAIDNQPIGNGKQGPITQRLAEKLRKEIR